MATMSVNGKNVRSEKLLEQWEKRRKAAEQDRKRFESEWMTAQQFAAGRQWAAYVPREHRMIVPPLAKNRSRHTADRLTQYAMTVVGQLAGDDFRGRLIAARDDAQADDYQDVLDDLLAHGWEREWEGDRRCLKLCRTLVWLGTCGIRVRFDPTKGRLLGDVPHKDGEPILEPDKAREFMAEATYYGEDTGLRAIREGRIVWDVLSPWNMLPPPGVEEPEDFPWEMVVRPVPVDTLRQQYPDANVQAESVQAMDVLGKESKDGYGDDTQSATGSTGGELEDHALVYTGYERPTSEWPDGATVVFTEDEMLEVKPELPFPESSCRPARSGVSYFHYWRVANRFWGRALAAPGFGPQRIINKRLTQMDEIIDRSMPKVYTTKNGVAEVPAGGILEVIELKDAAAKPIIDQGLGPGGWMIEDIRLQDENIEKAVGVRGVSLGENPTGVQTYGQLALLRESDADKIDPIAAELRLGLTSCTFDSIELTAKWPPDKKLTIVGPDDTLQVRTFGDVKVPADYMVLPAKGGTQLRTTGAELQKVKDIWDASIQVGRQDLLEWYVTSLEAGKAQEMPSNPAYEQQHIAALENILLAQGEQVPVAPFHQHDVHVNEHRSEQQEWQQMAADGDPEAQQTMMMFEQHIQQHLMSMAQTQAHMPGAPGAPAPAAPAPSPVPAG